jgi:TolA-binding protein
LEKSAMKKLLVTTPAPVTLAASESEETTPAAAETERAVTPQAPPTETVSSDPRERATELTRQLDDARAEIARLRPLADDGRAYRTDLVEQAITEGIRAYGNAFPVETDREMLGNQSLDAIKRVRDMHKDAADKAIPTGRTSVDRAERPRRRRARTTYPTPHSRHSRGGTTWPIHEPRCRSKESTPNSQRSRSTTQQSHTARRRRTAAPSWARPLP